MNLDDTFHRRESDLSPPDIDKLIELENDPKERTRLTVMNSISKLAIACMNVAHENQRATETLNKHFQTHLETFSTHVKAQDELRNQGRGAWKVLSWVIGIGQTLTLAFISLAWTSITTNQRAITELQISDAKYESRMSTSEARLNIVEQRLTLVDGKLDRKQER